MTKRLPLFLAVAICAIGAGFAFAQEAPEPEMYFIFAEHVKPSMMSEYETATKRLIETMQAHEVDPSKVSFRTVMGPEMGYVYVMPVENFAAMDTMMRNWEEAVQKVGPEQWMEIAGEADAAVDHGEAFFAQRRPELSYVPAEPRMSPEDVKYIGYGFYYIIPGKQREVEALAKEYVALYAKHGIDVGWSFYEGVTGADLPLFVVAHPATSQAESYATMEEINAKVGEEGKAIGEKVMACVRRMEHREGWIRPDLSYPPMGDE